MNISADESLLFAGDTRLEHDLNKGISDAPPWKVLIVDDDEDIHMVSKLVLNDFTFEARPLKIFSCYSRNEAIDFLSKEQNIALVLLDVVMETEDAGLVCARDIRDKLNNHAIRIILRTGQSGQAPEQDIITRYDINDYKAKTELTAQKLYTTVTASLRAYGYILKLKSVSDELQNLNINLEKKVTQRTLQLQASHNKISQDQKKLLNQQQQLVHAEKMASVGQLAAGVAHEINNPTGFVMANIETLDEYKNTILAIFDHYKRLEQEVAERNDKTLILAIERIRKFKEEQGLDYILTDMSQLLKESLDGTIRIKKIVTDLKNFSRTDDFSDEEVDLNEDVIETTLRLVSSQFELKHTIRKSLSPLPVYSCRPAELSQVLMSLIINACEAIKSQGEIIVSSTFKNGCIKIRVADNGTGIHEDDLLKLFDPFYTTNEIGKGTGLGLFISHGIVKNHGGKLSVSSEVGKGSVFTIALPVAGD
ncbi:MAG: ATP-binding protein [Bermanella sp.]